MSLGLIRIMKSVGRNGSEKGGCVPIIIILILKQYFTYFLIRCAIYYQQKEKCGIE